MKRHFYPDDYVASTYVIDFAALAEQGYRGVIFDVDNTLVPHGAPADERAIALFEQLHALGYQITLLSNNKEPRVQKFCDQVVGASYIFKAKITMVDGKPKVEWEPNLNENGAVREYKVFGKENLTDAAWQFPISDQCKFFKVEVSMPSSGQ